MNTDLLPSQVTIGSDKKVWWKCRKNHFWEAVVKNRAYGQQCPYCAGKKAIKGETDFATLHPELIREWDWERNVGKSPDEFTEFSSKKVWWK